MEDKDKITTPEGWIVLKFKNRVLRKTVLNRIAYVYTHNKYRADSLKRTLELWKSPRYTTPILKESIDKLEKKIQRREAKMKELKPYYELYTFLYKDKV